MRRLLLVPVLLAMLAACRTTPIAGPMPAPAAPAAATVAAHDNLNAVLWVQASAEYQALAMQTYRSATARLDAALADPGWDALAPADRDGTRQRTALPPAVILDVDETVLDNSPYQARMVEDETEYGSATWSAWVAEAQARALPGVVEFARAADARGITLVYLSNRTEAMQDATLANLRAEGLPVKDDSVFLGQGTPVADCAQRRDSDKSCRRRMVGREYRVLMQFGDQVSDFAEPAANTPQARARLLEQHRAWFGDRWWMLPNPTYGGWEGAVFDNAWDLPGDARRKAKRATLDAKR